MGARSPMEVAEARTKKTLVDKATKLAHALAQSHYAQPGARSAAAWSIERAVLVRAPTPPVCGLIRLGLVDTELYMVGGPCSGAMFFKEVPDSDKLQHTLALALDTFPILAGRIVSLPPQDGRPHRKRTGQWRRGFPRAVDCNNAGAAFTVLNCPRVILPTDRDGGSSLPPFPDMWQGAHLFEMTDCPSEHILDVLQVTFSSGCLICVTASHAILDGASMAMFMAAWSSLSTGVPPHRIPRPTLDRLVYDHACGVTGQVDASQWHTEERDEDDHAVTAHMNWCCFAPPEATRDFIVTEIGSLSDDDHDHAAGTPRDSIAQLDGIESCSASDSGSDDYAQKPWMLAQVSPLGGMIIWPPKLTMARVLLRAATDSSLGMASGPNSPVRTLVRLPADALRRMKAAVAYEARACCGLSAEGLSSNDVYCALLWRAMATSRKHRGMLDRVTGEETFSFVANTRQLVLPPNQQIYVGNATALVECRLSSTELRHTPLARVALALRAAKQRLTPDAVRSEMAFLQAHADAGQHNVMWNSAPVDGRALLWDWTKFPVFDLCFDGKRPFWFEPGIGASRLLPHICGAAPHPAGDGLLVFANVPADESSAFADAVQSLMAEYGRRGGAGGGVPATIE